MRVDDLTIALRARAAWEATDLGIALVRRHAGRIFAAWLILALPAFVLVNLAALAIDATWMAAFVLWWLKPLFDRIPLYVLSRAVFGEVPSLRETLLAQRDWGWRGIAPWLLWRRFHPGRAMLLAVDLLEGSTGETRAARVRVLARGGGSPNVMLTVIGVHLEAMLAVSIVLFGLMFVPTEFLTESARAVWETLIQHPPRWAQVCANACVWVATTVVEPFYVGAGFGLYLNRRVQLEGWDIELAFRRIASRLAATASALLAVIALALPLHAHATDPAPAPPAAEAAASPADDATAPAADADAPTTLQAMFGAAHREDSAPFEAAVKRAYASEELGAKRQVQVWRRKHADDREDAPDEAPAWLRAIGETFGFIARFGAWILLAALVAVLLVTHRRWLPWIAACLPLRRDADPLRIEDEVVPAALPDDVPAAVRALLRTGRTRDALALLYRASVERLSTMLGTPLPPGATESDCLRRARALPDAGAGARFSRVVRAWQSVAYAQRVPPPDEIEAILDEWIGAAPGVAS